MILKALSIRQPFATAIILGRKRIEYRSWDTAHRGDLVICAGLDVDWNRAKEWRLRDLPRGCALGIVQLVDVVDTGDRYEWKLKNPRAFAKPVPHKGRLGLYTIELTDKQLVFARLTR